MPNWTRYRLLLTPQSPKKATGPRILIGLAGYFPRFIQNFADIFAVLHTGTFVTIVFYWNPRMEKAFKLLKEKLMTPPVLAFSDFDALSCIDASGKATSAVLSQRKEDGNIPSLYNTDRTLSEVNKKY